jgi:hypothetical protein
MTSESVFRIAFQTPQKTHPRAAVAVALLACLLALFVRWYFVTHAQVLQPLYRDSYWGDAGQYYRYAWNLVHHSLFSSAAPGSSVPISDSFRDPAYPVFLAMGMAITDNYDQWYTAIVLSQVALGGLTVLFATLAIRDTLPTWLLGIAAATMALWPHLVCTPAYVLSENLTAPLCALMALTLREAAIKRSLGYTLVSGLVLSLAALSNAVLAPEILILALAFAWKRTMSRPQLLLFVAASAVPLLAWGIRNAGLSEELSPLMRAEINFVQGSWPTYHAATQLASVQDPIGLQTIDAINLEIANLHINHVQGVEAIAERMSHAPVTYIAWYLSKPTLLWGWEIGLGSGDIYMYPTRNSPFITNPVMKAIEAVAYILNGVLAALALAGLVVIAASRVPSAAWITFAVTAAWVTFAYGVLQSDARYSTPYRPTEIALACVAVSAAIAHARKRIIAKQTRP